MLVAQGYTVCNERKTSESSASNGSVSSSHDTKIPTPLNAVGAKRGRRLQTAKEPSETSITNVQHQNGSGLSVPEKKTVSGTVRSLRSRTVRGVGSDAAQTTISDNSQSVANDGPRSGMRLRNKKTLESTTPLATSTVSCPTASTETEDTSVVGDVYEFTDSENENGQRRESPPVSDKDIPVEERKVRSVTPPPSREPASRQPTLMTSPGGRLKLTLRMKRSPVLDEVIESGSSMGGGSLHQQNIIPVYEVLRVEGLEMDPESEQVHKSRVRRTQRRRSPSTATDSSRMGVLPTTKRLRLIFGNESHTIDLPPTNLSNFSAVE